MMCSGPAAAYPTQKGRRQSPLARRFLGLLEVPLSWSYEGQPDTHRWMEVSWERGKSAPRDYSHLLGSQVQKRALGSLWLLLPVFGALAPSPAVYGGSAIIFGHMEYAPARPAAAGDVGGFLATMDVLRVVARLGEANLARMIMLLLLLPLHPPFHLPVQ